ncbi:hypothetical protein GYMLUDRAFT_252655 [Collybiopsis luxurians FD-317 M1]|uniref:Unplaced genomic scaffold GYMLUscaffold_136, whole genome shotgun sequence n=1 Tax=Collybiopsis luxurians FD-317 M1 TaxID=944289 RepID=A0A0D0AKQ0_9AGAR|nr:hypothetical protein GYMLUDRAFT_252655 [Collybiopsis luxurians FD-317 M1]
MSLNNQDLVSALPSKHDDDDDDDDDNYLQHNNEPGDTGVKQFCHSFNAVLAWHTPA